MPHTALPLHIFEPRYRQMIRHALDGFTTFGVRPIAIALTGPFAKMAQRNNQLLRCVVCVAYVVQFLMAVSILWCRDFAAHRSIELMSQVSVCIVRRSYDQSKIQLWLFLDWRKCEVKCVRYFRDWDFDRWKVLACFFRGLIARNFHIKVRWSLLHLPW